jgi:hypothetical protein
MLVDPSYNPVSLQQPAPIVVPSSRSARRAALAMPAVQLGIGLLGALALALVSLAAALGFLAGAAVLAAGFLVFGWRTALIAAVPTGPEAFGRLLLGLGLKWLVIAAGLALALSAERLEPLAVLAGAVAGYLAYLFCLPWLLR